MLLSTALGLNQSQPMLDFVDIDLDLDFPLFLDPAGFIKPRDDFAEKCRRDLQDFFEAVMKAIARGNTQKSGELLAALKEPNETHLGVSKGKPDGRGIGPKQAQGILRNLQNSVAGRTGLLRDLSDVALFVEGVGADKISDMTTNIVRRHLIEYTQQQFELHNQKIDTNLPTGLLWETGNAQWDSSSLDRIPVVNGRRVLLVPKRYVRWRGGLQQASSKYYNHFVTNFIRDEQLRTNGSLVTVVKTKKSQKKVVYKKDIKKKHPLTKDFLATFSTQHPKEYAKFRQTVDRFGPVGVKTILEAKGKQFNETKFCASLIESLSKIPTGRKNATDYHHFITGVITYIFYPDLITPTIEAEINSGRKRIDIMFSNSADWGFFKDRKDDPAILAREVTFECKNYTDDIENPEIDQMAGRFDPRRGRFGIITCRTINDRQKAIERCRDVFQAQNGIIFVLCDADFERLLSEPALTRHQALQNLMRKWQREISV
jgi:hypothetical protein